MANQLYQRKTDDDNSLISLGSLTLEEPCYGTSATAIQRTSESQPKYIRITDFSDYGIEENHQYMTAETYSSKHLLKPNDILFARTGATVGKSFLITDLPYVSVYASYLIRIRLINGISANYIYHFFSQQ